MVWTIEIGDNADYIIEDDANFGIEVLPSYNDRGRVDFVEYLIRVHGRVVAGTPAAVASGMSDLIDEASVNLLPRQVVIKQDGAAWKTFTSGGSMAGPRVSGVTTEVDDGSGESQWRFNGIIYVKEFGNNASGAAELHTWIRIITNAKGTVIQKIWHAEARHRTAALAETAARTFQPKGRDISEDVTRMFQRASVIIEWTWNLKEAEEAKIAGIIELVENPIIIRPGGVGYVEDTQVGVNAKDPPYPQLHRMVRRVTEIEISGFVRAFEKNRLKLPDPHYIEHQYLKRQNTSERAGFGYLEDPERQIWRQDFHEVWWLLGDPSAPPEPSHGDHADRLWKKKDPAPADGPMNQ